MLLEMTEEKTFWDDLDPILSLGEVADVLKVSIPTLKRHLYAGKLKGRKVGRQWRIEKEEVRRYYENQEQSD